MTAAIFFVINATGQIPLFLALLAPFPEVRQRQIIVRELLIALVVLLLFTFFGDIILELLGITRPIIGIAGGILLFLISLGMIFPAPQNVEHRMIHEPLIIPLAIPVIAGPGAITAVMLYAHETGHPLSVSGAVFMAWLPSIALLLAGSLIKRLLGERGLVAIERLGGMLVCLIGIQMLSSSLILLIQEQFRLGR